ncbi:Serine/threonine protein kinase [Handroanthus impetiginosus]|uniref:Serine/threonine protein kinase n=1 Tax=Handroanthus impetiginosus TaxID=429701 RepID=A0A2G9H5Y2_9LAMI|nr:Serine/threonine protein kinase [Handroanthus impetiginosus]
MLRNLSISNNQLSGTITKEVGSIQSIECLDLSHNLFTGTIPKGGFANLKRLKFLDLHSNSFEGDVMGLLAQLGAVVYVDLSCNSFLGSLDLGIGNPDFISSVQYLNISKNNLTGELFPHDGIPYFDNLEVFDASENHFVGNVPSFSFVVSLRVIKLRNNELSGSLPQGLLQESSMILSELDLSHNQLEGPLQSITSVNLRYLNLSSNRLSGSLPVRIGHCAVIDLSNNMFTGNLSRSQGWGNYVEVIELSSNELTGSLPNQTSQFLRLTSLRISNNSLEGILPPILGTYPELEVIDFSRNKFSGFLLPSLFSSTKMTDINLSLNNLSGTLPDITLQNYSLLSLNLSHNELTGPLPPELGRFHNIAYLDLSNNLLEGGIPYDLPDTMMEFNVSCNNLSGVVPQSLQRFPSSSFHPGNNLLILPNEAPSPHGGNNVTLKSNHSRMKTAVRAALIAGLVGGALVIAVLTLVIYCRVHRQRSKTNSTETGGKKVLSSVGIESEDVSSGARSPKDGNHPESTRKTEVISSPVLLTSSTVNTSENPSALKVCSPDKLAGDLHLFDALRFTPEELSSAPAEAVGMSCHGTLYKAVLSSGDVLAVKLLKEGIAKGRKEFAREAKKLGNIRHPNLVSLQGFYWGPKEHEKLIISKYIDAPCLAFYLHGSDPRTFPPLSLEQRLKIALDVACCLTYLHTESAIPHGNLKSTNILVEIPNTNALLTDYSLHRLLTSAGTAQQVLNAGALGYLPPEFTSTSKPCPSLKSDVYAFGVILLELLTGRSCADIVPGYPDAVDLPEWVTLMAAENRANKCFDLQILGTESIENVLKGLDEILRIALKCILPADERPDMKTIFDHLSAVVL